MCLPEKEIDRAKNMALEAVVYPQTQDPFCYGIKDFYNFNFNNVAAKEQLQEQDQKQEQRSFSFVDNPTENNFPYYGDWSNNSSTLSSQHLNEVQETTTTDPSSNNTQNLDTSTSIDTVVRPKRRRARSRKNKEEIENQRMTHIAVERNRRKQMNEYLSVLRSLMPDSYIQRGDQASIIGGAINFVKELEHKFQFLGAQKEKEMKSDDDDDDGSNKMPFSEFFSFPQYSTSTSNSAAVFGEKVGEIQSCIADIEVTMVESHANLKIRSKKRPKQLLQMVSGFHNMRLTILHLNVTTSGEFVLFSVSVKVEDDCKLGSVDDIAAAVYQMVVRIQQEAVLN